MKTFRMAAFCSLALLILALTASAQQDVITTVAGPNAIPAIDGGVNYPTQIAVDGQGNVYVAAQHQNQILKISTTGILTVVAGIGVFAGYSGDGGNALDAELNGPIGVAVDGGDPANVYISDSGNCLVRKVDQSTGIITTVAGAVPNPRPNCGYSGDGGPAGAAQLDQPYGLAVNPVNQDVYVADWGNDTVRKIAGGLPTGTITAFAGFPQPGRTYTTDCSGVSTTNGAKATSVALCTPVSVSLDTTANPANVFISEPARCVIREVVGSSGDIYIVAGTYTFPTSPYAIPSSRPLSGSPGSGLDDPAQTYISVSGGTTTVTFADAANERVGQFTLTYTQTWQGSVPQPGPLITIAGSGSYGFCGDNGPALSACLYMPRGVGLDASGNIYIADTWNYRVRKITKGNGDITTILGGGSSQLNAGINKPYGVFADPASTAVYYAGFGEAATFVLNSATGMVSLFAGNGTAGFAGDGWANYAGTELNAPAAFAKDSNGNIYIADVHNCVIREVLASKGTIQTIAGGYDYMDFNNPEGHRNGCGFSGNGGPAVDAQLNYPFGLAIDAANNIYLSEYEYAYGGAHAYCDVRKIAAGTGIITTFAGNENCGYSGDGGLATAAELDAPYDLSFDGSGNLYIADTYNQRIRKVDATTHIITTVAGDGTAGYNGDGPATAVSLNHPSGVYADPSGDLFIADYANGIVRWVSPAGQLITFGGVRPRTSPSNYGFSGDGGVATSARFAMPARITQDSSGNFYIADYNNGRIRKITPFAGIGLSASSLNFNTQKVGTTSASQAVKVSAVGPITISKVAITAGFSEKDNCAGVTLAARQTCTINVSFSPATAGNAEGALTITDNAFFPASGNTVTLTGTGTP